ncbi:hypothetical protein H2202_010423 [Exophiala xenobiotica]|nr:hypothetical protein H2202_010423 [Exophiala xenobiotica]
MHQDTGTAVVVAVQDGEAGASELKCISLIEEVSGVKISVTQEPSTSKAPNLLRFLQTCSEDLRQHGETKVGDALEEVVQRCTTHPDFGGYGMIIDGQLQPQQQNDVVFLCSAFLEALKSAARAQSRPLPLKSRPAGRRGMTMSEKIFAMHDVSRKGFVQPGDIIQVDVDWVLASELSWAGMERVYDSVGRPGIFRNDRFWLAGDHRVEPPLYEDPKVKALMDTSSRAQQDFKMTDFQGFNYTIMHTEFVRERAQPGMLVIGADSHSCSAGAVGCLSIGMGATDVCMPLITGQTWFSVPPTVSIRLVNKPPKGIGGKDTILYILKQFKRNTIAADRVVEFVGPGLEYLSCDARFAIANMCTEFGAVTGIFETDERTVDFINKRRITKHKKEAAYFKADEDAVYADTFEVDLSKVESFVAIHPSPDNVVPVSETSDVDLDGCFIGACTTAEEDLITGALVLSAGLAQGLRPVSHGRRLVVPGSKPIRHKLEQLGLIDIYQRAGFKVGVPGCSSLAYLGSAATVAASSFSMRICDPRPLLEAMDMGYLGNCVRYSPFDVGDPQPHEALKYDEPYGEARTQDIENGSRSTTLGDASHENHASGVSDGKSLISGKVLRLGDFIDTDAIIPSKFLAGCTTNEQLGEHCMEFFMPEFRNMVKDGLNIVVAGDSFGCGSSRDVAVNTLLGAGVQCVIAKSFAFIYARNQPNIGLLGITITDEAFFMEARHGRDISIDLKCSQVRCGTKSFDFQLSDMEKQLIAVGGLTEAFKRFGSQVFDIMCQRKRPSRSPAIADIESLKL